MGKANESAVVPAEQQGGDVVAASPTDILLAAINDNADVARIEKLMDLQERWEKAEARRQYLAAMKAFKENPPKIVKDKTVSFDNTSYKHAGLAQITEVVGNALQQVGISHSWSTDQDSVEGALGVTCTLTHVAGHSESVKLYAAPDKSGKKNSIQAIGSSVTYLQRYTLLAITGLAAEGDDDGNYGDPITEDQYSQLVDMIAEVEADEALFCQFMNVEKVAAIRARDFDKAMNALKAKGRAK